MDARTWIVACGPLSVNGMEEAQIHMRWRPTAFGEVERRFEWIGSDRAAVRVDAHVLGFLTDRQPDTMPDTLEYFPWPLHKVRDADPFEVPGAWYMRDEGMWITARAAYMLRRAWRWMRARLFLTARVWGLADWDPYRIPTWRDLGIRKAGRGRL